MPNLRVRPKGRRGLVAEVTPESAGWSYVGFALHRLDAGESLVAETGKREVCLVLVSGKAKLDDRRQGFRRDRRTHDPVRRPAMGRLCAGRRALFGRRTHAARVRRLLGARGRRPPGEVDPAWRAPTDHARRGIEHPLCHQHHAGGRRLGRCPAGRRGDHAGRQHAHPTRLTSTTGTTCRTRATWKRPTITASIPRRDTGSSASTPTIARSTKPP